MTLTGEDGVVALACDKGLSIVKSNYECQISNISTHLKGMEIWSISFVKETTVILGVYNSTNLLVFDY